MALSKTQEAFITKVRAVGGGELGVALDDATCSYLVAVIAHDLGLQDRLAGIPRAIPAFFTAEPLASLSLPGLQFARLFEALLGLQQDADAYFYCLATLHKARLKYERILQAQAIPTIDQVGPRALLQFGTLSPRALAGFLFWRKWIFDIDNRAGQETGYLFEPIIAHAIGGVSVGSRKSPVKRGGDGTGRQVDCLLERSKEAYEIKLRVTIAASGQGRWGEELDFPKDCEASGYKPVLVVLDPTTNPKLTELVKAFSAVNGGKAYVGPEAWQHLEDQAGETMATFIERYVHDPMQSLLKETPTELPDITLRMTNDTLSVEVGGEILKVARAKKTIPASDDVLPDDVDDHIPTP